MSKAEIEEQQPPPLPAPYNINNKIRGFNLLVLPFFTHILYYTSQKSFSGWQGELIGTFAWTLVLSCFKNRGRSIQIDLYWGRSFTPVDFLFTPKRRRVGR